MSSNRNLQSFATTLQKKLTVPLRINKWDELKDFDKEQRINSLSRQLFVALYRKSTYLLRHHVWVLNLPLAAQWGGTPSSSTVQLRHHRKPCEPSIEESSKACSADRTRNKDTLGGHGAAKNGKNKDTFFQSAGYKPYFDGDDERWSLDLWMVPVWTKEQHLDQTGHWKWEKKTNETQPDHFTALHYTKKND